MTNEYKMNSSDVKFRYKTKKYSDIISFFEKYGFKNSKAQFLVSLTGINNDLSIDLKANDNSEERQISRVVYQNNSMDMDSYFGLITIVSNVDKDYDTVINKMAFLKNVGKEKYLELPNVQLFYQYLLGGIEPLYDIVYHYTTNVFDEQEIFDSMYEFIIDKKNIELLKSIEQKY